MAATQFDVSSMYLTATTAALKRLGWLDAVRAQMPAEAKAAFDDPHATRWHAWPVVRPVYDAVLEQHGVEGMRTFSYEMTKASFGPIVRPLVSVALALTGSTPASILNRLDDPLKIALRGVVSRFEPASEKAGALVIQYVSEAPVMAEALWEGVCQLVFELAGKTGRVTETARSADGLTVRLELSWD